MASSLPVLVSRWNQCSRASPGQAALPGKPRTTHARTMGDQIPPVSSALLRNTNRLAEAEPLRERVIAITVDFTVKTGHQLPHLERTTGNYKSLHVAIGRPEAYIEEKLGYIMKKVGIMYKNFSLL